MHSGDGVLCFALADPPAEILADLDAGREPTYQLQALRDGERRAAAFNTFDLTSDGVLLPLASTLPDPRRANHFPFRRVVRMCGASRSPSSFSRPHAATS